MHRFFEFLRSHVLIFSVVAALIWTAGFFELGRWSVYRAHPELSQQEQASAVLAEVSKLIQVPNEQPTMARINDAASAKKAQPFLVSAENDDILIIFPNAAEAILYRPSTNKLIAVGPVNTDTSGQGTQQIQTAVPGTATTSNATSTKIKK